MSGIDSLKESLKANNYLIGIEAANLTRSQIPGAKQIRGSLTSSDSLSLGKTTTNGAGVSINATAIDYGQGGLTQTGFKTDLAIQGRGFFVLFDAKKNLLYTRRGDFHFDGSGNLVNNEGLFVASFDPTTKELVKTTVQIHPIVSPLGQKILDQLKTTPNRTPPQLATDLGELQANIDNELLVLKTATYVTNFTIGPDTLYNHNLGQMGDDIDFDENGFVINATRGLKRGNQVALAMFPNEQGLEANKFGGVIFRASDAAAPGGIPEFGGAGDLSKGFGYIRSQSLESANSNVTESVSFMGVLQRSFTSTASAMKVFLSTLDDVNSTIR